jgi:hypothetical protein
LAADRPPDGQQSLDPISALMPWATPEEKPLRLRLHRAGATAVARATRSRHGKARVIFWLAADICRERTFARLDIADLQESIEMIARLFVVANFIERAETEDER